MADVTYTAAAVQICKPQFTETHDVVLDPTIVATATPGMLISFNSSGLGVLADADGAGTLKEVKGMIISMQGRTATIVRRGLVAGFNLASLAYGARVFPSANAGNVADAITGTVAAIGQVVPLSDSTYTKVLFVEFSWTVPYA